ncbi:MAG: hypothetical protein K8S20_12455 [Chloroflexi bacterium]|nr:hypothetical protein [Chloroflexota bacterium]
MKTKNIVAILLGILIFSACSSTTTVVSPTKPSAPLVTITISSPSSTLSPTKIIITPTETKPSNADFLAHSENDFPLSENKRGFFKFIGTMDLSKPIYEVLTAPDNITRIYASFIIKDGDVDFLVPAYWAHRDITYLSTTWLPNGNPNSEIDYYPREEIIKHDVEWSVEDVVVQGQPNVEVTVILDSGMNPDALSPMFGYINLFAPLWKKTNWDEKVRKFILTGDPHDLPQINGLPVLPAVSIRVQGSAPFWDE